MKVRIGPYLEYWGPYQIANLLQRVGVSEDTCDNIGVWLSNTWVDAACGWVHEKRSRTVKIKIHAYDTWSADHTLALITLPILKQLKAEKHGSPFVEYADAPDYYTPAWKQSRRFGSDYLIHARWRWVLNEMIFAFEHIVDDEWQEKFYIRHGEWHSEPCEDKPYLSKMVWDVEPITDWDGIKAVDSRIKNGLKLFGKYYQNLWD